MNSAHSSSARVSSLLPVHLSGVCTELLPSGPLTPYYSGYPMLSDTLLAVLFPELANHTELESVLEGTMWRKFGVGLSKRFGLSQHV